MFSMIRKAMQAIKHFTISFVKWSETWLDEIPTATTRRKMEQQRPDLGGSAGICGKGTSGAAWQVLRFKEKWLTCVQNMDVQLFHNYVLFMSVDMMSIDRW